MTVCYNLPGKNMAKFDGVIEAVRYRAGKIELVRVYERRGPTFSDHVLLNRPELVSRLREGKRFVTGRRMPFLASTFEVGKPVFLLTHGNGQVVTTAVQHSQDGLEGVPAF